MFTADLTGLGAPISTFGALKFGLLCGELDRLSEFDSSDTTISRFYVFFYTKAEKLPLFEDTFLIEADKGASKKLDGELIVSVLMTVAGSLWMLEESSS